LVLWIIASMASMALVFRVTRDWHPTTMWAPSLLGDLAMVITLRYFQARYKKIVETFGVKT